MAAALLQDRTVYEQLCKDYLNLKTLACGCCHSPESVQRCKDALRLEINSARKLGRMQALEEVLALLEARNALSMIKVELLARLEPVVKDEEFGQRLACFKVLLKRSFTSVRRYHLEDLRHRDRRTLLEKELEQVKLADPEVIRKPETPAKTEKSKQTPNNDSIAYQACRQDIFDLLTREISRDWNALGRNLQLSSASLYTIEERHPRDVRARVQAVLEQAEADHGMGAGFVQVLGEALLSTRRKDLKRKVEKMLS
uniref:Death domain-containing protein n=1 Tax=Culex tarsalis TaxID=7177 RepID=A0A1Q3F5T5_CULTA